MWCIHTTEYCSAIKKNKVRPFAVTWMDPEMIVLSEEVRKRKTRNDIIYRWNLKNDTGQYICETKIDAHTQQTDVWLLMGRRWGGQIGGWGCTCMLHARLIMFDSLQPHGLQPTRLLCPWDFPGKSTGAGCHFQVQGIFLTQGSSRISRVSCIGRRALHYCAIWEAQGQDQQMQTIIYRME